VAHLLGRHARGAQPLGGGGKGACGVFGDVAVGAGGLVAVGHRPQRAQALLHVGAGDVFQRIGMALAGRAGEVRVHLDVLAVADHQQRRVFQRQRIAHQLLQRCAQALAGGLVLPREVPAHPHVGKAVGALGGTAGLGNPALEAVGVGVGRLGHAQHAAQVDEVGLRPGTFVQRMRGASHGPFADEGLRGHGAPGSMRLKVAV
jgi:hypothetical protein